MRFIALLAKVTLRTFAASLAAATSRYRAWPETALVLDRPLALAEERTSKLRRIYANATRDAWDGPGVFRDAMARHGGIQLSPERRVALAHPLSMLMWGELGAWIVAAELAERLDDLDARMAATSQVFDEARHFYVLRDYVAALHVPVPDLDPYFAIGARRLLSTRDLTLKLFAMQILAEGTAQAIFGFLADARIEPVLSELLPYIERDEARHLGLGVVHLPERLAKLSPRRCRRLSSRVSAIADLFAATQLRYASHYAALGLDPRDLIERADKMLHEISRKLGNVPGSDEPYFRTLDPGAPGYQAEIDQIQPRLGVPVPWSARALRRLIDFGAWALPS